MVLISQQSATELACRALEAAGGSPAMAAAAAASLVLAESQGLGSHGLQRVTQYAAHLRNGRVQGAAVPTLHRSRSATLLVDARAGLAFAACQLAVTEAVAAAREHGVCFAGVVNSHHAGVMVDHLRPVAAAGMVGVAFSNSPAAMPAAGGRYAVFGTNPVAAIFPRKNADPLMLDLSLSEVARGKLMVAVAEGKPIPQGWALDAEGQPTTDPRAGLAGVMLPLGGGAKGATLALMVELLVTAVIGARFGFEASSFFTEDGNQPGSGQAFLVIDPAALAGSASFFQRVEVLVAEMLKDEGVRLPGARRLERERHAALHGISVSEALHAQLVSLASLLSTPSPQHPPNEELP